MGCREECTINFCNPESIKDCPGPQLISEADITEHICPAAIGVAIRARQHIANHANAEAIIDLRDLPMPRPVLNIVH